ncbi:MAG: sensor histidine kinase KdpD [Ruminococcaceae bacterium]|nr:sensor histidine kinase KdpD [Oscillospiraceae bacterium]
MKKTNTKEHILVCLSSSPSNARIIETAAKMAKAFGASFTALYVQTPASELMLDADKARLADNIRHAESLGANVATIIGDNVAFQIAEFSRLSGITKVVLGRSVAPKKRFFKKQSLTDQLIELAPSLDVHIIPDMTVKQKEQKVRLFGKRTLLSTLKDFGISVLILAIASGLSFGLHYMGFTDANIITVYILAVLVISALIDNRFCWVVSSAAGVLLFNFFFTTPKFSLMAYDKGYPVTFLVMLVASLVTGSIAARMKSHAKQSAQTAYRTKILLDTNQMLAKAKSADEIFEIATSQTKKLLALDAFALRDNDLAKLGIIGTSLCKTESCTYYPIHASNTVYGAIGIQSTKTVDAFENSILLSILGECALALESERNAREKEASAILAEQEKLRANLLRTISHDLRTPLTSISGNADNLLANDEAFDAETRRQIYTDIREDSEWLISLVENLLSVSRMGDGKSDIRMSAELVSDVIDEAVRRTEKNASEHKLTVNESGGILLARMDARLIVQVLINLIDNAIKYTPRNSEIEISAVEKDNEVTITVADNGHGIADEVKPRVFDMFYTGAEKIADNRRSLGLGLALCKSIVNAHGGEITVSDNKPHGAVFSFTLAKEEVEISE